MDESFNRWRDSPSHNGLSSFVISDSDEEFTENKETEGVIVIDSSEGSANVSRNVSPMRWSATKKPSISSKKIKSGIRKFISDDSDDEDDSCNNSYEFTSDRDTKTNNVSNGDHDQYYVNSSNESEDGDDLRSITEKERYESSKSSSLGCNVPKKKCTESELAISFAKEEIGVGNIDPLVAQKRALLICKKEQLESLLSNTKLLFISGKIELLPDRGDKLRESIALQEKELAEVIAELENTPLVQPVTPKSHSNNNNISNDEDEDDDVTFVKEDRGFGDTAYSDNFDFDYGINTISSKPTTSAAAKELGVKAQATLDKELALTVDRLQDLHGSLLSRPSEDEKAEDPQGLKVQLMPHQKHALSWLMWREQQKPPGGVLADDMGLGKTLTMISLILTSILKKRMNEMEEDSDEEWADRKPVHHKGGTLVVCPASLLSQWENEIKNRCKRGTLSVQVHHGVNRESVPKRLANYDVVITTYNILSREFKSRSTLFRIHWERAILDEAHIVRNHKSQASEAVCGLVARKRWALSGTPIQNKEMDLYSILKFLNCSPFNDLRVWKRWVDNKNAAGRQRLATVMKSLMLRRTKLELQLKGDLDSLPEKFVEEIFVTLDPQEQLVYEKVLIYSRTLFAQFLAQRAEKDHMVDLAIGKYDKPSFLSQPNKNTQFTKAQNKLLSLHADVKTHEILVLLLRLRQICVHPALIQAMLDQEDMKESGIMEMENLDPRLLSQINGIRLHDSEGDEKDTSDQEIGVDHRVTTNVLTSQNPIFNPDRLSSKMKMVLNKIGEILEKNDKLIIVSQWTSMLNVVASYLPSIEGASFSMFTGNVPIKERQGVMDAFNTPNKDPYVLLLSLTAGGVGLNLVGGNHLMLIDIHWNPQLEVQAQDRIYRFGQKKNVHIYKFLCKNTIEERIKQLQERKLDIAQHVLTGDKSVGSSKLTLNDLKSLFAL